MMTSAKALLVTLALCAGLCACGSTSSAPAASATSPDPPSASNSRASAAASAPIALSPQPGTPDASPSTQISFLGPPGTHVSNVRVVGSHSGVHTGVQRAYSTGTGESFLPTHAFVAGERVNVSATVTVGSASYPVRTNFTVAHQAPVSQKEFPINPGSPSDVQHYSSAPSLTPSTVRITTPAKGGAVPGDLFLAPYQGDGSPGPMISEQNGSLIWFHPLPAGEDSTSLKIQQYQGRPVLSWWQGVVTATGQISTRRGKRAFSRCMMSRITAPVGDVITPITSGRNGNFFLRAASNRPSAANRFLRSSSIAIRAPSPASSICSTISW